MEVPWVKRLPSEYVWEHVRFTTQPIDQPPQPHYLHQFLEMVHGMDLLMFATDYPHWDADTPTQVGLPAAWRQAVFEDNARAIYTRLPRATDAHTPVPAPV